jgi:Ribonuclease G/E
MTTLQSQIRDNAIMRELTEECHVCKGRGYTRNTETVMLPGKEFKPPLPAKSVTLRDGSKVRISLHTFKRGSGCPHCHGTGRVAR